MQDDGRVFGASLSGRKSRKVSMLTCVLPWYSEITEKKGRQWLKWVISSQGKPRSQWVWPTAAHLEPMRRGEDLLKRESERKKRRSWVRGGFLIVPGTIHLLTSRCFLPTCASSEGVRRRWVSSSPHQSFYPPHTHRNRSTILPPCEWDTSPGDHYFTFIPNQIDFLYEIHSATKISKHC